MSQTVRSAPDTCPDLYRVWVKISRLDFWCQAHNSFTKSLDWDNFLLLMCALRSLLLSVRQDRAMACFARKSKLSFFLLSKTGWW